MKPENSCHTKTPLAGSENALSRHFFRISYNSSSGQWQNGQYVVNLPFHFEESTYLTGDEDENSGLSGYFYPSADNRGVAITRVGAKNEWDSFVNGVPVKHGDTTYSYTLHQSLTFPSYQPNSQGFDVLYSGDWSTDTINNALGRYNVTWNWAQSGSGLESGTGSSESYAAATKQAVKGNLDWWLNFSGSDGVWSDGESQPGEAPVPAPSKTATLKYFARDNVDNVTAEARYELTVHEPVELVGGKTSTTFNIATPAYTYDENGVWTPTVVIHGDATHTYNPGDIGYAISRSAAKSQGYSVGFEGGITAGIDLVLGYNHIAEKSWGKEEAITAYLNSTVGPGDTAYLEVVFVWNRYKQKFRLYDQNGEIRRTGSPAVPAASIPFSKVWDHPASANPTPYWHKLAANELEPDQKVDEPIGSAPPIVEGDL